MCSKAQTTNGPNLGAVIPEREGEREREGCSEPWVSEKSREDHNNDDEGGTQFLCLIFIVNCSIKLIKTMKDFFGSPPTITWSLVVMIR